MKKMLLMALITGFVFMSVSCIVVQAGPRQAAPPDPDQVLMQRVSRLSEGMAKADAVNILSRKPSMVEGNQWYFYFNKERNAPGYPDYMQTGYLIEFRDEKIDNIEPLWRNKE